jgi:ABC-type transport system substrate-binding protein
MKSSKVLAFVMLLALAASILAGCGGTAPSTAAPAEPQVPAAAPTDAPAAPAAPADSGTASKVVVAINADPANLGPFVGMSMGRISVLSTMYEYLFFAVGPELKPYLAKSFEQKDDKTFIVTLFDTIIDSAGNKITAADVVFSYNTAMAANAYRPLGDVASVKATGDYTVEIVTKEAVGVGGFAKIGTECPVVSQKAYEASSDQMATKPITTAVYTLTEYVPGSSLTFERRADYWQKDASMRPIVAQANVQTAVFQIITEQAQHTVALQTGSADISTSVPGSDIALFDGQPGFNVTKNMDNLTQLLAFNGTAGNPFTSKELRQAVSYAIDKKALCEAVAPGACNPSHVLGNSNFIGYMSKWDTENYYDYDLAKAKELFAASGAKQGLTVTLLAQNDAKTGLIAQVIQADLAEIGITVNITQVEPPVFNTEEYVPEKYDLLINAAAGGDYIFSPWQLMFDQKRYNGTTSNWFKDDQLQKLMDTAADQSTFNDANVDAAWQYLKEQDYMMGLLSYVNNIVSVSGVTKVHLDFRGFVVPGACEYAPDYK